MCFLETSFQIDTVFVGCIQSYMGQMTNPSQKQTGTVFEARRDWYLDGRVVKSLLSLES